LYAPQRPFRVLGRFYNPWRVSTKKVTVPLNLIGGCNDEAKTFKLATCAMVTLNSDIATVLQCSKLNFKNA